MEKSGWSVRGDPVRQKFIADVLDRLSLTDIAELSTSEGKDYLCAIKDVYSIRIFGYSIAGRTALVFAVCSMRMAIQWRGHVDIIANFDQRCQSRLRFRRGPAVTGS